MQEGSSYACPQPASTAVTIVYGLNEAAEVKVFLYNTAGMPAADFVSHGLAYDSNTLVIGLNKFAPGIYYYIIKATTASGRDVKFKPGKFLVIK